jgi:hypothetical protein
VPAQGELRSMRVAARVRNPHSPSLRIIMVLFNVNATSEHELYLKLFITNGGGW